MSASPLQSSPIVKKSLDIYLDNKNRRNYLKWGFINAMILSVLMYDIKNKCPFSYSNWYYVEYVTAGLLAFSVLYYFTKFLFIWLTFEPIKGTQAQQKLLHFEDGGKYQFQSDSEVHSINGWNLNCFSDSSFIVQQPEKIDSQAPKASPLDTSSIISWHSSFNDGELKVSFSNEHRSHSCIDSCIDFLQAIAQRPIQCGALTGHQHISKVSITAKIQTIHGAAFKTIYKTHSETTPAPIIQTTIHSIHHTKLILKMRLSRMNMAYRNISGKWSIVSVSEDYFINSKKILNKIL